jgi:hypothetical protein
MRLTSDRLVIGMPLESGRSRFVELFTDPTFMAFSGDLCDGPNAHQRFDQMFHNAAQRCGPRLLKAARHRALPTSSFRADRAFHDPTAANVDSTSSVGCVDMPAAGVTQLESKFDFSGMLGHRLLAMASLNKIASINAISKQGVHFSEQAHTDGFLANLYRLELA